MKELGMKYLDKGIVFDVIEKLIIGVMIGNYGIQ